MNASCLSSAFDLDDIVQAYEAACASGDTPDLASFFPPFDHPRRREAMVELLRVDLEYAWQEGIRDRLDQQVARFAPLLDQRQLAEVAYEDFRLRRLAGEAISRTTYAQRFDIVTSDWAELPVGEQRSADSPDDHQSIAANWLDEYSRSDPVWARKWAQISREMPEVGQDFEGFELVSELGRGAFGRVFLARQGSLANRAVALKVTPQFCDEPQHLAQLQHTNIVPIYSLHQRGLLQAICMPYLGASTLADVLRARGQAASLPLSGKVFETTIRARHATTVARSVAADAEAAEPPCQPPLREASPGALQQLTRTSYVEAVVRTMARLTGGLAYAHDHGVIHRDLKPANVLLSDDGQPLILDFHIAAQTMIPSSVTAVAGGTVPYMAPESLQSLVSASSGCDPRSDIYSVGVILFELLTRRQPFPHRPGPVAAVVREILADRRTPPTSPRLLNPAVSPGLAAIVLRCLAYQPADRYSTAQELHEDLQRHLADRPLRFAKDRSPLELASKWARRHPRLSSASTVLVLSLGLLACIAASWMFRGSQLAGAHARESLRKFQDAAAEVAAVLDIPGVDEQALNEAVATADRALKSYAVSNGQQWRRHELVAYLNDDDRTQLATDVASLHFLLAAGQAKQGVRADTIAERARLLDVAMQTNSLAARVYPGKTLPLAFALQKTRLQNAKDGVPRSAQDRTSLEGLSDAFEDRYLVSMELTHRREWQESAELLQPLLRDRPQDYKLWITLGICRYQLKELADAEGCFSTAISLRPELWVSYFYRSVCRLQRNHYRAAIDDCDALIERRPKMPAAYINRAIALNASGQTRLALEDLATALELGTAETRVYFLRAKWKQALGDSVGAAADRAEGLSREPGDELSWVARAVARLNDDPAAALADCQEALRLNPASHSALQNIAYLYGEKLSQPDQAIVALSRLIELEPRDAALVASRGVFYARTNQREAAIADAAKALKLNDDAMTHYQAARIYALNTQSEPKDAALAIGEFAAALQKQPSLASRAQRDSGLKSLRTQAQYKELIEAASQLQLPPRKD